VLNDRLQPEKIWIQLKGEATKQLNQRGLHPQRFHQRNDGSRPHVWANRGWCVYLDTDDAIARAIAYVVDNPICDGKPQQMWPFVVPFIP
jgi:hypothetical protein